jgi:hypothetical protein
LAINIEGKIGQLTGIRTLSFIKNNSIIVSSLILVVLNMHELFGAWREETMFEIVLNMHELFGAWRMPKIHWFKQISWQQFTVSRKWQLTAIYRVKRITFYSNLLCQANYRLQQFTTITTLKSDCSIEFISEDCMAIEKIHQKKLY